MPVSFQLISKETKEPERFAKIDDEICEFLGVSPDPVKYHKSWYDRIGFAAACGVTFEEMREEKWAEDVLPIIDWLDERYTINCWR